MELPEFQTLLRDVLAQAEATGGRVVPLVGESVTVTAEDGRLALAVATLTERQPRGDSLVPHDWRLVPPCF